MKKLSLLVPFVVLAGCHGSDDTAANIPAGPKEKPQLEKTLQTAPMSDAQRAAALESDRNGAAAQQAMKAAAAGQPGRS